MTIQKLSLYNTSYGMCNICIILRTSKWRHVVLVILENISDIQKKKKEMLPHPS